MNHSPHPPQHVVDAALLTALSSPCQKSTAVEFHRETLINCGLPNTLRGQS